MAQDINRLKVVLAEQKRTNKWLAEQLGKDPASVSKWCTNALFLIPLYQRKYAWQKKHVNSSISHLSMVM